MSPGQPPAPELELASTAFPSTSLWWLVAALRSTSALVAVQAAALRVVPLKGFPLAWLPAQMHRRQSFCGCGRPAGVPVADRWAARTSQSASWASLPPAAHHRAPTLCCQHPKLQKSRPKCCSSRSSRSWTGHPIHSKPWRPTTPWERQWEQQQQQQLDQEHRRPQGHPTHLACARSCLAKAPHSVSWHSKSLPPNCRTVCWLPARWRPGGALARRMVHSTCRRPSHLLLFLSSDGRRAHDLQRCSSQPGPPLLSSDGRRAHDLQRCSSQPSPPLPARPQRSLSVATSAQLPRHHWWELQRKAPWKREAPREEAPPDWAPCSTTCPKRLPIRLLLHFASHSVSPLPLAAAPAELGPATDHVAAKPGHATAACLAMATDPTHPRLDHHVAQGGRKAQDGTKAWGLHEAPLPPWKHLLQLTVGPC